MLKTLAMSLTGLALAGTAVRLSADSAAPAEDPIAYIGHGAMFSKSDDEIRPNLAFLAKAQDWYIQDLKRSLSPARMWRYRTFEGTLKKGLVLNNQSQLVLNSYLIDWLLDNSPVPERDRIRGKNNLMKRLLRTVLPPERGGAVEPSRSFVMDDALARRLAKVEAARLKPAMRSSALSLTPSGGAEYRAECLRSGVPVPPDFGPGSAWVDQGVIAKSDLFILRNLDAQVLTWKSSVPEGMCIALPRFGPIDGVDKQVQFDGVICVGVQTAKTCFWDNEKNGNVFEFDLGGVKAFSEFGGGTELLGDTGGICSDCHAGENPYIIHGKILNALAEPPTSLPTFPIRWYDPIVRSGDRTPWPENPGPMDAPPGCSGCHGSAVAAGDAGRLPLLSASLAGYCGTVLRSSIGALPPPAPGDPLNAPASMPQGKSAGTLACTPGLSATDPRYRACSAATTEDCTPGFGPDDPRRAQSDFPKAYKVMCTPAMSNLLRMCLNPPPLISPSAPSIGSARLAHHARIL